MTSPSRDGCTITVSLEGPVEMSKIGDREISDSPIGISRITDSNKEREELVIVAVRILVGSTSTDSIPTRVYVQGRPVELSPSVKR